MTQVSENKVFGGRHVQYRHQANSLACDMRFAIFLPPQASENHKVPVLYWLSGLTCTDENFMQKAGALRIAAELGMAIVAPDTSPRGEAVPDDADNSYDFGHGAGFYVDATEEPWSAHYQMYTYIRDELPTLIEQHFPVTGEKVISGHSMGGHGALVLALRNPGLYRSVTAFSPICNPSTCPWGEKALSNYLGEDKTAWQQYDASILMVKLEQDQHIPALVTQGGDDEFLEQQLKPDTLVAAAKGNDYPLSYELQPGYDHSYYFISSFIEQHLRFHARHLGLA
ncbi:S-formylglutathione hydrolase [Thalassomonas actiniarum]|uniref:S-formylglutathione hydrolase n=1 Tax=Thalassomonas actiniarum TaxID=485447 RepID=A0AAE9YWM0_9GAMM|nr:S-formylglutathione hydrolase [Thalassomonas actiniarum]